MHVWPPRHRLFFFFFLKEKVDPRPRPLFPAGIKGPSGTCYPGNTFSGPERGRHSNRHWNLPLQALAPAHTLVLLLLLGGLCCDGGRGQPSSPLLFSEDQLPVLESRIQQPGGRGGGGVGGDGGEVGKGNKVTVM